MNNITMIPICQLLHHPENPRKDLGDLTELAESIKQNGIMQNLTVVQVDDGLYNVVIGNRRMAAAEMAGLEEVPCVISEMDYKTQVATMLMENMQRQDLTVFEQAQGFQMMMDLGYTANGASLTTIGKLITKYALRQRKTWGNNDLTECHNWKAKYVREVLGLKKEDYEDTKSIWEEAERRGDIQTIRLAVAWIMGGGVFDCDTPESRMTDWDENYSEEGVMANMIKERYEFLKEIGYVMSDMEIQLMNGTHECYKRD